MRSILILFILSFLFAELVHSQATKVVLVEEVTGTWCQWCTRGDIYSQDAVDMYPDNVAFVAIHGGSAGEPMGYDTYVTATGMTSFPNGSIDRTNNTSLYPSDISSDLSSFLSQSPPANVNVTSSFNTSTREITIDIEAEMFANLTGDYRLGAIVVENGVTGPSPSYDQSNAYSGGGNGPMGGYENLPSPVPAGIMVYDHVARYLPGGYNGEAGSLPGSMTNGQKYNHTFNYTLPNDYNEDYIKVIGFMIDNSNGQIVNAGLGDYILGYSNASPFFHSSPFLQAYSGLFYEYDIVSHDPDHDNLTLSISSGPAWLNIVDDGEGFGKLSGIPASTGMETITIQVTDGNYTVDQTFTIIIEDPIEDWEQVGTKGFSNNETYFMDLHFDNANDVYLASANFSNDQLEVFKFSNNQWTAHTSVRNNVNAFGCGFAIEDDGTCYFADDAGVLKYDGNTWIDLGMVHSASYTRSDIIIDGNGTPVATAIDQANAVGWASYYDGSNWQSMGSFSDNKVGVFVSMKLDNNGYPIIIYGTDGTNLFYSEVRSYDGTQWNLLGGGHVSSNLFFFDHDVAVSSSGEVYAVQIRAASNQEVDVYKIMNGNWQLLTANISGGGAEGCKIELNDKDEPIVTFNDLSQNGKVSAMLYENGSWRYLGIPGFTDLASSSAMNTDNNGVPYVAYDDINLQEKLSVKKYIDLLNSSIKLNQSSSIEFSVYPNPSNGSLMLNYKEGTSYQLIDLLGKVCKQEDLPQNLNSKMIDLSGLNSGQYFIKLSSKDKSSIEKIIIQNL